ncbi:hypothetical protein HanIR_Chr04g0163861 [Helianthus annuus]|nr:hypothetical protein HanIR_Chr04g0163861 [Helianthus annuus]
MCSLHLFHMKTLNSLTSSHSKHIQPFYSPSLLLLTDKSNHKALVWLHFPSRSNTGDRRALFRLPSFSGTDYDRPHTQTPPSPHHRFMADHHCGGGAQWFSDETENERKKRVREIRRSENKGEKENRRSRCCFSGDDSPTAKTMRRWCFCFNQISPFFRRLVEVMTVGLMLLMKMMIHIRFGYEFLLRFKPSFCYGLWGRDAGSSYRVKPGRLSHAQSTPG